MSTGTSVQKAVSPLTDEEKQRLANLEQEIRPALGSFLDVAEKLYEIAKDRLYRDTHASLEDYLDDRWGLSRSWGNQLIKAHKAVLSLPPGVAKPESVRAALAVAKGTSPIPETETTVAQEDPAITWARSNGVIPADADVTTVKPESAPLVGSGSEPESNGELSEPTDEEWLATLAARPLVCERLRPLFDDEALAYRDLEPAREAYKATCKTVTGPLKKEHRGRIGPWLAIHQLHFKINHPADWQACKDCEGQGILPLVKEKCSSCKGSGYHVG